MLQHESTLSIPRQEIREALPVAVTIGPRGIVCVTDATTRCGHLFDSHSIRLFSTTAIAGLSDPMDIVVEESGGFVCTDSRAEGGRTIRKLDFFGNPAAYGPDPPVAGWRPEHLLVTRDGNYVTTDPSSGLLAKHDATTGELLWKRALLDERAAELIGLGRPAEAPDGRLFLPVPGDHQILVLSGAGEMEAAFGGSGGARGRLSFPVGVAFCPDGMIAVLDRMRHVVLFYDEGFRFVSEFGRFGAGPTDFYYPTAIAAGEDGRVYVAQGFQARVHQFRFAASRSCIHSVNRSRQSAAGRAEWSSRARREGGV